MQKHITKNENHRTKRWAAAYHGIPGNNLKRLLTTKLKPKVTHP
jgi:hypothetical protein